MKKEKAALPPLKAPPENQINYTTIADFAQARHGNQSLVKTMCILQMLPAALNVSTAPAIKWEVLHHG